LSKWIPTHNTSHARIRNLLNAIQTDGLDVVDQ